MIDTHAFVTALAQLRPVFHSEADFQHAFAWELHLRYPQAIIRLERPIKTSLGLLHVDLVAEIEADMFAFELKYKTRAPGTVLGGELFRLRGHGAQPPSRYDFLKDVARLESLREDRPTAVSWAILLTNDSAYWCEPRGLDGTSAKFSLSDGRACSGRLDWGAKTSAGTKRKREDPIELSGKYCFQWRDYSSVEAKYYSRFRYLAVEVVRPVMAA